MDEQFCENWYGVSAFDSWIHRHKNVDRQGSFLKIKTRIVRGSDYSPASELFSSVRKTMTGNNPKLDLVNVDARKKDR